MAIKAPLILSLQVGLPKTHGAEGAADPWNRPWTSAIYKDPVEGPVWLGKTNLKGDAQADLTVHGGPDMAVLAYSAEHYPGWRAELGMPKLAYGSFGENFTVSRLTEESVCVGDTYEIGDSRVQVSQPRQPCGKLARRMGRKDIIAKVHDLARGGWYFRVLTEGFVERGNFVALVTRPCPQWTIAKVYDVMNRRYEDLAAAAELAECSLLSQSWRQSLKEAAQGIES